MENEESNLIMHSFIDNEMILKCIMNLKELGRINNKLWNLFLNGDGSMTKNLKFLFPDLKLDLVSKYFLHNNNSEGDDCKFKHECVENVSNTKHEFLTYQILKKLKELINFEFFSKNIIERKIIFYTDHELIFPLEDNTNSIKMIGLSFWDEEFYRNLYPNKEDENKPIGLIMIEKEIEFFKSIKNFRFESKGNKFIFRMSSFKIKNQMAFALIEIFEDKTFIEIFGDLN